MKSGLPDSSVFVGALLQLLPQLCTGLLKLLIVHLVQASSGQHDDVQIAELMLLQAKSFPHDTLYSISLHGQTHIFLGDNQPQSGLMLLVMDGQKKNFRC